MMSTTPNDRKFDPRIVHDGRGAVVVVVILVVKRMGRIVSPTAIGNDDGRGHDLGLAVPSRQHRLVCFCELTGQLFVPLFLLLQFLGSTGKF